MGQMAMEIWRKEGPTAFYKGLGPTMLGLGHIAIQFPLYEMLKNRLSRWASGEEGGTSAPVHKQALWQVLAASSVSKLVASTIAYPHELIRARLQDQRSFSDPTQNVRYRGMLDVIRHTVRGEGVLGLWQGYSINIVRTVPQCMITFGMYEWLIWNL